MNSRKAPEVWLRGPLPGISPILQPAAHTLLEAQEEIHEISQGFPEHLLWTKPAGLASVGFHLQHIPGVLDRLLTYAKGLSLSESQFAELSAEGYDTGDTMADLLKKIDEQIRKTVEELKTIDPNILTEKRDVGRQKLPSTVLGLIFHSAEHTMRHVVQLLVTATLVKEHYSGNP